MEYPKEFNVSDYDLPNLINNSAITLDQQVLGRPNRNYASVNHLSKILKEKSREFRTGRRKNKDIEALLVLREIFPSKKEKVSDLMREYSEQLISLSEDLSLIKKIPKKRVRYLINLCTALSTAVFNHQIPSQH